SGHHGPPVQPIVHAECNQVKRAALSMNTSHLLYVLVDNGSRSGARYATTPKHHDIPRPTSRRGEGRDVRGTPAASPGSGAAGAAGSSGRGTAAHGPAGRGAIAARRAHRRRRD